MLLHMVNCMTASFTKYDVLNFEIFWIVYETGFRLINILYLKHLKFKPLPVSVN